MMYSGDEDYDDDITSGGPTDDELDQDEWEDRQGQETGAQRCPPRE